MLSAMSAFHGAHRSLLRDLKGSAIAIEEVFNTEASPYIATALRRATIRTDAGSGELT